MKKLIFACAIVALSSSAFAANITFTFGNKTKTFVVSAPNAQRIVDFATAAYPTIANPAFNPACTSSCPPPTIANPDPVGTMIDALWEGIRASVRNNEKVNALKAVPDPSDIN